MYNWVTLLYSRDWRNIVNQLYFNKKMGRILGHMGKARLYRQNHTKKHTHTYSQKEKRKKYIYISIYIDIYIKEDSNQIYKQIYQW